ncbi:inhibitor of nuclear factor kappa-B kinase subunit alpha [Mytilus galloprovincialis]|uniref:IkappaB kinase n=1 Tax=Mytilus galloprovincialis TaxID=29158 RepID=A0A8B6EB58_MYTGA|nr:inhibitor of nuclear factor kappa-B kinase subunit alpha [Mytilus galloprovincialis]
MSATLGGEKGGWKEERLLGSGGFGAVHLWKDKNGEYIALKRCRVQNEMTARHRQRWALEVNIMKKLVHPNVIGARDVPPELDVGPEDLPLLAMEYCSGGDLRKILNKPESCCGLKEYEVRCLVKDIASAVEYLHSKRIIHRDLKPENIVLQPSEDRIIYKLIDLGYAKELDQGSVCTSFVGTLQYLAPELFASQKYTCTVDYWSFGTVVFECITGVRPFLPQSPPVQWHREVCKKSPDDICAYHDSNGEVRFSKTLFQPNYLCRTLQAYFEKWLRMILRWDPKSRGHGLVDNRPKCFTFLDTILNMKMIHILNVATNSELQVLSYPITEQTLMIEIQQMIEKETRIPIVEQDILLASGASPDPNKIATQCWNSPGDEDWVVFLFKKGEVIEPVSKRLYKPFSPRVQDIVKEPTIILTYQEMKKAWGEAVYYCSQQLLDYKRLILSQRASMLSLLRTNSEFVKLKNIMINEWEQLLSKKNYFKESLAFDIDHYKYYVSNGGHQSNDMFQSWLQSGEDIDNILSLKEKVDRLDQQAAALQTKIMELNKSPFSKITKNEKLEECERKSRELYQELRQAGKVAKENVKDHKQMVQVVVKCVITRDSSLHDLFTHLSKICSCKCELSQLEPEIKQQNRELAEVNQNLLSIQKQRQDNIWKLLNFTLKNNVINRQDSKSSSSSNEQASMLMSICGESSIETSKVVASSKDLNKKLGDIVDHVILEQEELFSMDWNFLSPKQENS